MASCLADISVTYDYIIRLLNLSCADSKNRGRPDSNGGCERGGAYAILSGLEKAVDMLID